MREAEVWDLPTRVFHWGLAACVVAEFFTGEDEGWMLVVHSYLGYIVGLFVIFRVVWGVLGPRHARFSDFVRPWPVTRAYLAAVLRLRPPRHVGHNPLGGLMILLMLAVLALAVVTGILAAVSEGAVIPFFGWTPHWLAEWAEELHEGLGNFMMLLAAIHVFGVLAGSLLTGDNLTRAMITGKKRLDDATAAGEGRVTGAWRAVVIALPLVLFGGYLVQNSDFSAAGESERGAQERENDD